MRAVDLTTALKAGRASAVGVLHRWYGPGQGRPASSPGLLVQLSLWYGDGSRVVHGSDRSWREHPAEWLPSAQRNSDVGDFVEWVDGRDYPEGWASPGFDEKSWSPPTVAGLAGTAPFTHTYPQRTSVSEMPVHPVRLHTVTGGSVVADFGAIYAARPKVSFPRGEAGRTVTVRAGYLLDPDGSVSTLHGTQETNLTSSYIMREGSQAFETFTYLGFRYLQIDNAGQRLSENDIVAVTRHAAMPDVPGGDVLHRQSHAQRRLAPDSALVPVLLPRAVRRHADPGEGSFLVGRGQRIRGCDARYGDQNMTWQALRDVARGQSRYWPDGQVNAVYPNGDGAGPSERARRATPSGCGATSPRPATTRRCWRCTRRYPGCRLAVEHAPGRDGPALRPGRHRQR